MECKMKDSCRFGLVSMSPIVPAAAAWQPVNEGPPASLTLSCSCIGLLTHEDGTDNKQKLQNFCRAGCHAFWVNFVTDASDPPRP